MISAGHDSIPEPAILPSAQYWARGAGPSPLRREQPHVMVDVLFCVFSGMMILMSGVLNAGLGPIVLSSGSRHLASASGLLFLAGIVSVVLSSSFTYKVLSILGELARIREEYELLFDGMRNFPNIWSEKAASVMEKLTANAARYRRQLQRCKFLIRVLVLSGLLTFLAGNAVVYY